jgi:hypothetical protein
MKQIVVEGNSWILSDEIAPPLTRYKFPLILAQLEISPVLSSNNHHHYHIQTNWCDYKNYARKFNVNAWNASGNRMEIEFQSEYLPKCRVVEMTVARVCSCGRLAPHGKVVKGWHGKANQIN